MNKPVIAIIVAHDLGRVIGQEGQIPWHLPADFRHFKATTMGKPMIMGRKTHESIGRPLPGRRNLVISRQPRHWAGCEAYTSLHQALAACAEEAEVMIIGGSQLYEQALPLATRIYQTVVHRQGPGDAHFPQLDPSVWQLSSCEDHTADARHAYDYSFRVLERV